MRPPNRVRHKFILQYGDLRTKLRLTFRNVLMFFVLGRGSMNSPIHKQTIECQKVNEGRGLRGVKILEKISLNACKVDLLGDYDVLHL